MHLFHMFVCTVNFCWIGRICSNSLKFKWYDVYNICKCFLFLFCFVFKLELSRVES